MSKFERKIRRKQAKEKKKLAEKEMASKVAMFGNLGDACLICYKEFDKTNKDMVRSWNVVVREEEKVVRLYCPNCWDKAKTLIEQLEEK